MSLTIQGNASTLTSAGPITTTTDPLGHPLIAPDAVRFLIIAATVAVFFGSITCLCCLTYRIRKAKMRRVVVTAFEQGVFDRELVRERIARMHRGDPNFSLMFPTAGSGTPEYFDKLERPCGMRSVDWDAKVVHAANLSVEGCFQPLSAQVQVAPTSAAELQSHPYLSSLPLEEQLALLFHASRDKEERKRRKLERNHTPDDPLAHAEQEPELVLSVMITMPRARRLPEGGDGDLAFGTTGFRWRYEVAAPTSHVTAVSNDNGALAPARL